MILGRSLPLDASFPTCTLPWAGLGMNPQEPAVCTGVLCGAGKIFYQMHAIKEVQFIFSLCLGKDGLTSVIFECFFL